MTPAATDMPERSAERLVRAETRLDEHGKMLAAITPLVAQHAVLDERVENFRGDLNEGLAAIRSELAEMKRETSDRAKERRTMLIALFVAGLGMFGTFVTTLVPLLHAGGKP